jgi:arabinose-5-phosphate isomerase
MDFVPPLCQVLCFIAARKQLILDAMTTPLAKRAPVPESGPLAMARQVLTIEAQAVAALLDRLDQSFVRAHELLLHCKGRVAVSGMGKSGHIARKLASTLASTGTPAFFMHPAEASHGDLGMITGEDAVLALSNSGESNELLAILPYLKRRGTKLVAITGNPDSTLAREADAHLDASIAKEACPLNLAPTASTTASLALGDALALSLLDARGFSEQDFALMHPGGALGKRLLVRVRDLMRTGEQLPKVPESASLKEALLEMTDKGLGLTTVVGADGKLLGVFTDGDLRRSLENVTDWQRTGVKALMTSQPRTISADKLGAEAAQLMQRHKITSLLVTDPGKALIGVLHMHDLMRAGVV